MRPQTHTFDFYKDNTGWYIDFPAFIEQGLGTKGDLAMVSGADAMLEYLGQGNERVHLGNKQTPPCYQFHFNKGPRGPFCV